MNNGKRDKEMARSVSAGKACHVMMCEGQPVLSVYMANTFVARLKGLFAYKRLASSEALMLQPCSSVHTLGFKRPIDVIFLDTNGRVLKCSSMKPYGIRVCPMAHSVVEMVQGTLQRLGIEPGQQVEFFPSVTYHE